MPCMLTNSSKIKEFIINQVGQHPSDLVALISKQFGISRQRAYIYVSREVKRKVLIKIGKTSSTKYFLARGKSIKFKTKITKGLDDYDLWAKNIKPMVSSFPPNVREICTYGFTEIFNNAIDHSEGTIIYTDVEIQNDKIIFIIMDNGMGIFQKIQDALKLDSKREAILHLSKGKFTTDPSNHTGEGIFFTSRAFDAFSILSEDMYYTFSGKDWFLSPEKKEAIGKGTYIRMALSTNSKKTLKDLFRRYTDEEIGFGKTTVAVALSADTGDPHISRSQAKRLLLGLDKFKWVILDFKGVESIGQAFVDEVFRVFNKEHPEINIRYFNANKNVKEMIERGMPKN